ncbi:hypothetical protein FACS1894166_06380 [Bacilli bacterium]|nr:hypothetical protein FACS1894166_06380 [Bacilli bacterium]
MSENMDINNIKYHNVNDNTPSNRQYTHDANKLAEFNKDDYEWDIKNTKDYGQISIPADFTETLINYVDASITRHGDPDACLKHLRDEQISF